MGESAPTLTSACQESAMVKLMLVKAEMLVSLAMTMLSVEGIWLVDRVLSGHLRLSAYPWVMLIPDVKLIMIASPGTSAGKNSLVKVVISLLKAFALRSIPPQMMRKSFGIRQSIPIENWPRPKVLEQQWM